MKTLLLNCKLHLALAKTNRDVYIARYGLNPCDYLTNVRERVRYHEGAIAALNAAILIESI